MTSPFAGLENATLTFKAMGAASKDPVTGNRTYARSDVVIAAMLTEKPNRANRIERSPGVDPQAVYLEGYVIDTGDPDLPERLPDTIKPNTWAEQATWDGRPGRFYLLLTGRSPFGVEESTGDKIRGWFQSS